MTAGQYSSFEELLVEWGRAEGMSPTTAESIFERIVQAPVPHLASQDDWIRHLKLSWIQMDWRLTHSGRGPALTPRCVRMSIADFTPYVKLS